MTINKVYHFFICLKEKKKKKKSRFTKLLNLLSPRLKRRANYGRSGRGEDDDNEGVPRKTLVTATIRRESDAANADVPGGGGVERADDEAHGHVLEPHLRSGDTGRGRRRQRRRVRS
jgi:hypothetical protein